jgi:hypothetical protein
MGSVHRDTFRGGMPMAGRAQRGNLPVAFTSEQLREAGEYELLCGRHADWCQRLVTRAETEWISDREAYWHARLTREHPNLRAAINYCLDEVGEADCCSATSSRSAWPAG